jgi:hypothetical protein
VGAPCPMAVMYCTSKLPSVASHTKPWETGDVGRGP